MINLTTQKTNQFLYEQSIFEFNEEKPAELRLVSQYVYAYKPNFASRNSLKAPLFGSTDDGKYLIIFLDYLEDFVLDDGRSGNLFLCEVELFKTNEEVEALLKKDKDMLKLCQITRQTRVIHKQEGIIIPTEKNVHFTYIYFCQLSAAYNINFKTLMVKFAIF